MTSHEGGLAAWHILQISGPLDVEFATALAERAPVVGWQPERSLAPWFRTGGESVGQDAVHNFTTRSFPVLPGYARPLLSPIARTGPTLARVLRGHAHTPGDVLVCTAPYLAPVAELWPGPVVYWLTDLIREYPSSRGIDVEALDARMVRAATLLCPNSTRLRDYLLARGGDAAKILVLPNATRQCNIYDAAPSRPAPLPAAAGALPRPVAGVVGNLAGNLDWLLLDRATQMTPGVSWLFVGPTDMEIPDRVQREARARVMARANALFVGRKPYGELVDYARAFDVAVVPYLYGEPTYSGSSTRFYEHLAACRPILATRAFEELLHKEPYLTLVDTAEEIADALRALSSRRFDDGNLGLRWQASRSETWQARAEAVMSRLEAESVAHSHTTPRQSRPPFAFVDAAGRPAGASRCDRV